MSDSNPLTDEQALTAIIAVLVYPEVCRSYERLGLPDSPPPHRTAVIMARKFIDEARK